MIIDLEKLKIDLGSETITINGKTLSMKESNMVCSAFLCVSTFYALMNKHLEKIKEFYGVKVVDEEKLFELASKVSVLMVEKHIPMEEALDKILITK